MNQPKQVPADWARVLNSEMIERSLSRMSYEILESNQDDHPLAIVGIRTGGEFLAKRILSKIKEIQGDGAEVNYGVIDITLYRDDLSHSNDQPLVKGTEMDFRISGARIVLVDDVLYTGRTVRAALDAIIDFGRPSVVELAVVADRGHRELPIRPDYVGKNLPTEKGDFVRLRLSEFGYEDGLYIIQGKSGA